jgi:hypothetical protein
MLKNKLFENLIDMTGIETKRTYVFSDKELSIENFTGLIVNKDQSHIIVQYDNQIPIPSDWLAFYSESPTKDFSFSVVNKENQSDLETWICLQGIEKTRTYLFNCGFSYTINKPSKVYIKKSGSHKIVDEDGIIHYISKEFTKNTSER